MCNVLLRNNVLLRAYMRVTYGKHFITLILPFVLTIRCISRREKTLLIYWILSIRYFFHVNRIATYNRVTRVFQLLYGLRCCKLMGFQYSTQPSIISQNYVRLHTFNSFCDSVSVSKPITIYKYGFFFKRRSTLPFVFNRIIGIRITYLLWVLV